jgi:hypothetical protein
MEKLKSSMVLTLREVLVRRQKAHLKTLPESPKSDADRLADLYVFGNEVGGRIKNVKTAWETAVLRAHGVKPERTRGKLSAENRAKLAEIDLNFHDLRHEAGSRKLETGWPLHAVSAWLGHTKLETTAKYLNVTAQYLHELDEPEAVNARPRVTRQPARRMRLKPADDGGFNLFKFPPSLGRNRHGLKIATVRDERPALCPVREVAAGAPSRRAIGRKMTGKDRVRRVASEVVPEPRPQPFTLSRASDPDLQAGRRLARQPQHVYALLSRHTRERSSVELRAAQQSPQHVVGVDHLRSVIGSATTEICNDLQNAMRCDHMSALQIRSSGCREVER